MSLTGANQPAFKKITLLKSIYFHFESPIKQMLLFFRTRREKV